MIAKNIRTDKVMLMGFNKKKISSERTHYTTTSFDLKPLQIE